MDSAVLLAAGSSSRMGAAERKPFLTLAGRCVLDRAAEAFDRATTIEELVVVCRADDIERVEALRRELPSLRKVRAVVAGGEERTDSVRAGVAALSPDSEVVAVHDVARPLVRPEEIDRTVEAAREHGAALLALPVTDTIKTSPDGRRAESTLDRDVLWRAQTPQAFRTALLREHLARALEEGFRPTDDAALHERYAGGPVLVRGSEDNLKLTTERDLLVAAAILEARGGES